MCIRDRGKGKHHFGAGATTTNDACFICGSKKHWAANCPQNGQRSHSAPPAKTEQCWYEQTYGACTNQNCRYKHLSGNANRDNRNTGAAAQRVKAERRQAQIEHLQALQAAAQPQNRTSTAAPPGPSVQLPTPGGTRQPATKSQRNRAKQERRIIRQLSPKPAALTQQAPAPAVNGAAGTAKPLRMTPFREQL